jgi:hypothetical protein
MKRIANIWWVFVVLLFLPIVSQASTAIRLSLDQLVSGSTRVVVAKLNKPKESFWGPNKMRIYSMYTFEVQEELVGKGTKQIVVIQPGGRVGDIAQRTDGYSRFEEGQENLLFLKENKAISVGPIMAYRVVGMSQGVFGFKKELDKTVLFQKIEGLHFPNSDGQPILEEKSRLFSRIRKLQ